MRFLILVAMVFCWVSPTVLAAPRTSPSVREAIRRGRLPGETSQQLRRRLSMLRAMDKLNELGAEATPSAIRLGPKYRGGAATLALLKEFYRLEVFEVIRPGSQISDSALAPLNTLPLLRSVRFEGVRLSGTSLTHIARLPNLKQLAVIDTGLSDNAFRSFASVRSLEAVRISEEKFMGQGLRHFQRSSQLNSLQLEQSGVTDESLKYLDPFRALKFLSVTDTAITDEALTKLWNSNPGLLIVGSEGGKAARKGELLGVPITRDRSKIAPRRLVRPRVP